jgi:hypothetical protein
MDLQPQPPDPLARFEALIKRVENSISTNPVKPVPPSRKMPYYNQLQSQSAKKILDMLIEDQTNRVRIPAYGVAITTIRNQFYQGCMYLMEKADPDGKYAMIRARVSTRVQDGYLVVFVRGSDDDIVVDNRPIGYSKDYSADIDEFIQNSTIGDKLPVKEPIYLSNEDVEKYTNMFVGLEDSFLLNISNTKLLIVRK